ncbi:MAG TPA: PaaX domain-containing protein, C- domain protein, partial [Acidimicrobiia bacterium]|nr:PaaX domain-containing protein, C- domain protein [Acidimicrobiia bacterium]
MSTTGNTPLTARSVLASVLLGTEPPWLPTRLLVRTAELFGIADGTARVALSRMASAGEAVPEGGGYRLVGRL